MSQELIDFSEQIDEQFDIADTQEVESDDFWESIVNLFIWYFCYSSSGHLFKDERPCFVLYICD